VEWYPNGKRSAQVFYKKGVQDGSNKTWNENGTLAFEGRSENGKLHGETKKYTADGVLIEKGFYQ
jgi:antitoxin component YwqK of YwqJK toxin-antitoxin module